MDRDEDLQYADIINACADGYAESELVKRYSTVGMGPSQGRHSALAAASLIAAATGRTPGEVGVTTGRPPLSGEKLGVLAGRRFLPVRHTAMHARHLESGARMMLAGPWLRPAWYGPGREQGIRQEALAVRRNVGMIDVSTLGGIEIRGPEAVEFMNRIYTFGYAKQKVGRTRYVLMTNLAGNIIDDGISCRLHDEHFYVTATTGGADNVYRSMLWWNAQWRLDVSVVNATAAWAGISLSGPRSREVLSPLCTDIDLSPQGFPYLGVRTGTVGGIPARVLRVGFVGELGYEIHVPSSMGEALWDALLEAGRELDIRPVGIEAQRILRLEKGHLIVGQDTDAMATPAEAGMGWAIARRKPFFVGGRSPGDPRQRAQTPAGRLPHGLRRDTLSAGIGPGARRRGDRRPCDLGGTLPNPGIRHRSGLDSAPYPPRGHAAHPSGKRRHHGSRSRATAVLRPGKQAPGNVTMTEEVSIDPERCPRRSPIYRTLARAGAVFAATPDGTAAIARRFGNGGEAERRQARELGLADLSPLPRCGFKGAQAAAWLRAQHVRLPRPNNRALAQAGGALAARLAEQEFLLLDPPFGGQGIAARLEAEHTERRPAHCHPVPWQDAHAWFLVSGERAAGMLARLCGVDLRPAHFAEFHVAQTSAARVNVIFIRRNLGPTPAWHLLSDQASSGYLWDCLRDAGAEYRAAPVGIESLAALEAR